MEFMVKNHGQNLLYVNIDILVGGLEPWNFMTFHSVGVMSSSQLTNSMIFQRGGEKPPTSIICMDFKQ